MQSFPFSSIYEYGFGLIVFVPDWVQSHLPRAGTPRAASSARLQMVSLAGEGQVLGYMVVINGFLNGRKLCCYLFGSIVAALCVERKNVANMFSFIIIITHHLLLKVEVAFKRVQTARNLAVFPQKYVCF